MKMHKYILPLLLLLFSLMLVSCTSDTQEREKPLVMTTLFPHYDIVREIAGDLVEVKMILPLGSDAHHFEPTPKQMTQIKQSDLVIFTGLSLEPWMKSIVSYKDISILDLSRNIDLIEIDDHDHDDDHSWIASLWESFLNFFKSEDEHHDFDPHFWLDPVLAIIMVNDITDALITILPEHETLFLSNRDRLILELETLNDDYVTLLETVTHKYIMHGGHNAFSYFALRYGIEYVSPFEGFSSDAEPKAQALAQMISLMQSLDIKYLFAEVELAPNVATMISEATGATILYVYNAANISQENLDDGLSYMDMMRHNFNQFRIGMLNE